MAAIDRAKQQVEMGHAEDWQKRDSHVKAPTREHAGIRICERCGAAGMYNAKNSKRYPLPTWVIHTLTERSQVDLIDAANTS